MSSQSTTTTPPQPPIPTTSKLLPSELQHTLNDLLEKYLNLLHRYHTLQQALGGHLSSGFLSLASANFSNSSSSSSRFRYGQDFYDERMRALRTVSISPLDAEQSYSFTLTPASTSASASPPFSTPDSEDPSAPTLLPAPSPSPPPAPPRDPLHWFGILVPAALRQAQGAFKSALEENIMEMATTATEMRGVEIEVRRTRKRIKKGMTKGEAG